jgi:hypothetical protein
MSRHLSKKQRRNQSQCGGQGQFVRLFYAMIDSEAWSVLSHAARVAYIHLRRKVVSWDQQTVVLTYEEMKPIMHRRTYAKAIRELEEVGMIRREQYGGLYRKTNIFSFSQEWKKYEANRTKNSKGQVAKVPLIQVAKVPPLEVKEPSSSGKSATCL